MANWYCSKDSGNDGGAGSSGDPYENLSAALSSAGNGDTIYMDGSGSSYVGGNAKTTTATGLTIIGTNASWTEDGTIAVIDSTGNNYGYHHTITAGNPNKVEIRNVEVKNATLSGVLLSGSGGSYTIFLDNCSFHDNGDHGFECTYQTRLANVIRCDFYSNTNDGWNNTANYGMLFTLCRFYGNNKGITVQSTYTSMVTIVGCKVYGNSNSGVNNCINVIDSVVDNNSADGASLSSADARRPVLWFSGFTNNGFFGVDEPNFTYQFGCGFYGNGSANNDGTPLSDVGQITTDPDYVDASNGDFTLNTNTTWGANLISTPYDYWSDIGFGRDDPAGSGGGPTIF